MSLVLLAASRHHLPVLTYLAVAEGVGRGRHRWRGGEVEGRKWRRRKSAEMSRFVPSFPDCSMINSTSRQGSNIPAIDFPFATPVCQLTYEAHARWDMTQARLVAA
jgi:hypothetical protein